LQGKINKTHNRDRRDWMKEKAFTGGDLGIDSVSMGQEVSRGHSSWWQRADE